MDKNPETSGFFFAPMASPSLAPLGPVKSDPPETDATKSDATPDSSQSGEKKKNIFGGTTQCTNVCTLTTCFTCFPI